MKYKIGSFNLKNFSKSAITSRDLGTIAEIIRNEEFDVVAFQEILSEAQGIDNLVKYYLKDWDIRYTIPRESADPLKSRDHRGEVYAIIWNTKRLSLATSLSIKGKRIFQPVGVDKVIHLDCGLFARCPMFARFEPVNGGYFEFRLINIHMHFGGKTKSEIERRKEEYNFLLEEIYPRISMERKYGNNREAYTIVLGDYNLNLYKPRGEAEKRIDKNTYINATKQVGRQRIITVQDELTSLKSKVTDEETEDDNPNRGYSQNYDHFSFDLNRFEREGIKYHSKRVDAVRKYCNDDFEIYRMKISDHIPISLEISMNEEKGSVYERRNFYERNI